MNALASNAKRPPRAALAVANLFLLHACAHDSAGQTSPATPVPHTASAGAATLAPPEPAPKPHEPFGAFMTDHFFIATFARDCVIAGDLEALREPLTSLADYRYEAVLPASWVQRATALQAAARTTAQASSLEAAAAGVAMMGRICGDCHVSQGHGPTLSSIARELRNCDESDTLRGRMSRHSRGADQLWLGLMAPSAVVWQAGAKAIAEAGELAEPELPASFLRALAEVRELGARAETLQTSYERADVYGALLTTCADCHSRVNDHEVD